jgi:hypothetical protein
MSPEGTCESHAVVVNEVRAIHKKVDRLLELREDTAVGLALTKDQVARVEKFGWVVIGALVGLAFKVLGG